VVGLRPGKIISMDQDIAAEVLQIQAGAGAIKMIAAHLDVGGPRPCNEMPSKSEAMRLLKNLTVP